MRKWMRADVAPVAMGLGLGLVACSQVLPPPSNGGVATNRGSAGSGTGGTAAGSGSTTGDPGSCNANPGSCPPPGTLEALNNCRSDQVELEANLVGSNFANSSEPITCPILLTDVYNPSLSATTNLCGYVRYCVAPETQISFLGAGQRLPHLELRDPGREPVDAGSARGSDGTGDPGGSA